MQSLRLCYSCSTPLVGASVSREHLISFCIGGNATSLDLLCRACNSTFGCKWEGEFAQQMALFSGRLKLKNAKNKGYIFKDNTSGLKVKIDDRGKISLAQTLLKELVKDQSGTRISYHVPPDVKAQKAVVRQLERKYGKEKLVSVMIPEEADPEIKEIELTGQIGGTAFAKSIQKMVLNVYLHHGGDRRFISDEIQEVFRSELPPRLWFCPAETGDSRYADLYHVITVVGRKAERLLFGFARFFGGLQLISVLNDNYDGPEVEFTHAEDPLHGAKLTCNVQVPASREQILGIISNQVIEKDNIDQQLGRLESAIRSHHWTGQVIDRVFDKVFKEHPDAEYMSDLVPYIVEEMMVELMPNIRKASAQRREIWHNENGLTF